MELIQIHPYKDFTLFHQVFINIHKHFDQSIYPIISDIKDTFDKEKNKNFKQDGSDCTAWIVRDEQGKYIGRIAAFYSPRYKNLGDEGKVGGIGFFECINSTEVAKMLFDACKEWFEKQDIMAMDGPINFGSKLFRWGLLVEGKKDIPFLMTYMPNYYQQLFEQYGFQTFYHQYCYDIHNPQVFSGERLLRNIFQRLLQSNNIVVKSLANSNENVFIQDFCGVYNSAWGNAHGKSSMITAEDIKLVLKKMKLFYNKELILMVYANNVPVSFLINIPDLNFYFKNLKGKISFFGMLFILFKKTFKKPKTILGTVFGTAKDYQNRGFEAVLFFNLHQKFKKKYKHINKMEFIWFGEFNHKMISMVKKFGFRKSRKLITYRYIIDKRYTFKKHPVI